MSTIRNFAQSSFFPGLAALSLLAFSFGSAAQANLVTNGTFDTDLSGWTNSGSIDTTWISGTAHLGRPGTPGFSIFEQSIDIPLSTPAVSISFEYEWQVSPPTIADIFSAEFTYESSGSTTTVPLVFENSDTGLFNSPTTVTTNVALASLDSGPNNGTVRFRLDEMNLSAGTRIQLDNVQIQTVPEASAVLVWSTLSGLGFLGIRRRKAR